MGLGSIFVAFIMVDFSHYQRPSELVGINPKIENEEQALLFIRFYNTRLSLLI